MKSFLMTSLMLLTFLLVGCSTTTKVVRKIEQVDKPILVQKNYYPPDSLLQPCDTNIDPLPYGSTWFDLIKYIVAVITKLDKCANQMDAAIKWKEDNEELDLEY